MTPIVFMSTFRRKEKVTGNETRGNSTKEKMGNSDISKVLAYGQSSSFSSIATSVLSLSLSRRAGLFFGGAISLAGLIKKMKEKVG